MLKFTADKYVEADGTVTLSLNEIDLIENADTEANAKRTLADSIMEYAVEYYNHFSYYNTASNRKRHVPYIFKALAMNDVGKIEESIEIKEEE